MSDTSRFAQLVPFAAAVALFGCAANPEAVQVPQSNQAAAVSDAGTRVSENIAVAAVVDLTSPQAPAPDPCRKSKVTGSRITRVQCEEDIPESQRILNEQILRSGIEQARQIAMLEQQRRAQEAAAMRQMQMSGQR